MDLEEACHNRGVWVGRYRRSILHILANEQKHASVDQIHQVLRREHPKIRLATVYRTVKILEKAGVLIRLDLGDTVMRYEAADDTHHDHLIDQHTGAVVEFQDERVRTLLFGIATKLGYTLTGYRLNLYGSTHATDATGAPKATPSRLPPIVITTGRMGA